MIKLHFLWFKSKRTDLTTSGLLGGFTDFHCHLLPGVDDGVQTMEESLEILAEYEKYGIREVWLTPHIMEDIPNTTADLRDRFLMLKEAYHGSIQLHLAAEYMLDNLFAERLAADDLLPLTEGKRYLLVETSYFNAPINLHVLLDDIRKHGYYPLLAHPERYEYMSMADYHDLKSAGIAFQLNLPSLTGAYGRHVQKKAEKLLKQGYYDLYGSDTHRFAK